VSESKQSLSPNDPAYYAPPRVREKANDAASAGKERGKERQAVSLPRGQDDLLARFRNAKGGNTSGKSSNSLTNPPSDAFAEAVARTLRAQIRTSNAPSALRQRSHLGFAAALGAAVACAALVALACVMFLSPSKDASDGGAWPALRPSQSAESNPPSTPLQRVSTLVVRNHGGLVNEPLQLGVSVDAPDPAATVTIKGMLPGARLTAGVPLSFTEWRVPVAEISSAMVIPPADFVGELNLFAELHNADGAAQVSSAMQLVWTAAAPATALATSSATPPSAAPSSAIPAPQPLPPAMPQPSLQAPPLPQAQPLPQQQTIAALPATPAPAAAAPQPRADTVRELSPNEIAALVRRAQELLATGDVKAARALLLRATEAHDPRAALALAKTFDPIVSRQSTTIDAGPDLNQARTWYQRAREWGAPEAQRQLDALASYR
jgi:hypothetical protein